MAKNRYCANQRKNAKSMGNGKFWSPTAPKPLNQPW